MADSLPLPLSQDDFIALGQQLADAAIFDFQRALIAHAATVDEPAPTTHSLIETIVRAHGGEYIVIPPKKAPDVRALMIELARLREDLAAAGIPLTPIEPQG